MKDIYKSIFTTAFIWGTFGGLLITLLLYIKKGLGIPSIYIFIFNNIFVVFMMIICVYLHKRKLGKIGLPMAREMAFLVYLIIIIHVIFIRLSQGYFNKFEIPVIILSLVLIYFFGRILSYIIGINMYNLKSE